MEPCLRGNDAKRVGKACHRVRRSFSADTICRTRSALYTNTNVDDYGDGAAYTLKLGLQNSNKLTIRAEGTGPLQSRKAVDVRVQVRDLSVWNNAIFAGGGGAGARINGNVVIAGSVHILGEGLGPTGTAADLGGTAGIFNWYTDIDSIFTGKLPNSLRWMPRSE